MHSKTGEEKFELALTGKKALDVPIENLKQVLRLAMLKLGIRAKNLPDEEEKQILIQHILEYYGNHTCEEIKLAFDLAIAGKLNIDVKAYENFSCLYFSQIMIAYREWTKYPMQKVRMKQERLMLPYEHRTGLTDEEMIEWYNETLESIETCNDYNFLSPILYNWASNNGEFNFSNEKKKDYFNKAIVIERHLAAERSGRSSMRFNEYQNFLNQEKYGEFNDGTRKCIENTAKKLLLFDYLKNMKIENRV